MSQVAETRADPSVIMVAIGANMPSVHGDCRATVAWAVTRIADMVQVPVSCSRMFATPAFPAGAGPDFVNAAVSFDREMDPQTLLQILHNIEADALRARNIRWGQRTLDLDLIGVGQQVLPDRLTVQGWQDLTLDQQLAQTPDRLILPHPRLQDRSFVLVPLADVAPDWMHPTLGQTVLQMRDARADVEKQGVKPLAGSAKRVVNPARCA